MVKLESDGTFIVHSGGADIGTGLDTVVAKLTAEVLHCPLGDVHVISGDTDHALFDKGPTPRQVPASPATRPRRR